MQQTPIFSSHLNPMEQKTPPTHFLLFPIFHRSLNNNETTQRTTCCLPLGKKQSLCCWDIFLAEISCILQDTIWLSQMLLSSGLPARHLSRSSAWHPTHIWEILLILEIRNGYWILRLFSSQSATPVWQKHRLSPENFPSLKERVHCDQQNWYHLVCSEGTSLVTADCCCRSHCLTCC